MSLDVLTRQFLTRSRYMSMDRFYQLQSKCEGRLKAVARLLTERAPDFSCSNCFNVYWILMAMS